MNWFDEQIKQRQISDDQAFSDAFKKIGDAVNGRPSKTNQVENAIEIVLKYYGYKIIKSAPESIIKFEDRLDYICRPHGLMFRKVRLNDKWYKNAYGAFLGKYKDTGDYVAIIPFGLSYKYFDGTKYRRVNAKNAQLFEIEAYSFYRPFPNKKLNLFDLVKYCIQTRSIIDITIILGFMVISTLLGLLMPKMSYFMYSTLIDSKSISLLLSTITFYLSVQISTTIFSMFQTLYNSKINAKMTTSVSAATMMRVLSLPASFFRQYSSGETQSRLSYVENLCSTLMSTIFNTGFASLFSLVYIGSIFKYAPSLVYPALISIIVTVSFSVLSTLLQISNSKKRMEVDAKLSGLTYATVSGISKIRVSGSEKRAFNRWADLYAQTLVLDYNPPLLIKLNPTISLSISLISNIVLYYFALNNNVNLAEYNAFSSAYGMVFATFSSLASTVLTYASIKPTIDMAKPILDSVPEISEGKEILDNIDGDIEINNVSFRYDETMPNVINNLSLKIKRGQYIAIVGKTGCGKSTLIRLLLGFEKPDRGTIYYDGKDIDSIDLRSLRRKIGVVMQNGKLFQGDIFSNIVISNPDLTLDDAWEAARIANIADDIEQMPMGMSTYLSEGSGGISGGQKQRLMIARAIASKPKILIFDEATSALDNITQRKVSESLDSLNCTRIVIAHRLSTIKHCDRILYLEDGEIKEDGTYDELIKQDGLFAKLVERQRLDN